MECLKFSLTGDFALFKDPYRNDVETTYPHIHKPVLLGMLGAILGLGGRGSDMEYYKILKDIGVSILPSKLKFDSFVDNSVNSTGYAISSGDCQMIKKQLLINPKWEIILTKKDIDSKIWEELKERIKTKDFIYGISLGQKRYFANIENVSIEKFSLCDLDDVEQIDSIMFDRDVIGEIENRRIIFIAPTALENRPDKKQDSWEYLNDKFLFTKKFIDEFEEDVEIYSNGELFIRFI